MRHLLFPIIVCLPVALGACASVGTAPRKIQATAVLLAADSRPVGNASLFAAGDRLDLRIEANSLPPGLHGAHLHAVGRCEPKEFTSAGGHLNPAGHQHGSMNPRGSHLGDLPNLTAANDGSGALDVLLAGSRAEVEAAIFDADGTAIVIHAAPDDYRTDPSGASGARIACGVFARVR